MVPHLEADPGLLALFGGSASGHESRQVLSGGLQYHWRSDLAQVLEEEVPLVSRICGLFDTQEVAVEHLALPIARGRRVHEIRGWFTFGEPLDLRTGSASLDGLRMFRGFKHSQPVRLPAALSSIRTERPLHQGILGALGTKLRSDRSEGAAPDLD